MLSIKWEHSFDNTCIATNIRAIGEHSFDKANSATIIRAIREHSFDKTINECVCWEGVMDIISLSMITYRQPNMLSVKQEQGFNKTNNATHIRAIWEHNFDKANIDTHIRAIGQLTI